MANQVQILVRRSSAVRDVLLQTVVFVEKHGLYRCETASIHERQDIRMLWQGCILLQCKDSDVRSPSHCAATPATLCLSHFYSTILWLTEVWPDVYQDRQRRLKFVEESSQSTILAFWASQLQGIGLQRNIVSAVRVHCLIYTAVFQEYISSIMVLSQNFRCVWKKHN